MARVKLGIMLLLISCFTVNSIGWGITEEEIEDKIDQTKKQLTQTKIKEHSVLGRLNRSQKELDKISSNLQRLNSRIGNTEKNIEFIKYKINNTEGELKRLESEITKQQTVLSERILAIYKYGYQSYLEVLFEAEDFGEFITRFDMVKRFVMTDVHCINTLREQQNLITQKKEEISKQQEDLEKQKRLYARLHNQNKYEQTRYISTIQNSQAELSKIQKDRQLLEKALDELESLSKSMESQIRDLQNKSKTALGSGKYVWPVSGDITSYFGNRMHPVLKKRKFHSGIDIAAGSGTSIAASDYGVVIFSGRNGGYGLMITLDHGAGISTIYAHCSQLLAKKGETVSKGQTIAKVGSTGLSTGPHLHFEVRKDGVPVNPLNYI
ncbi:MAG: peptidoglycan DD-metalloendopeptidase family protein [Firmicutes bacterium]|nr:peptidoglycan DD-metalloendopeptidase family protein [Bacillota bacterium]